MSDLPQPIQHNNKYLAQLKVYQFNIATMPKSMGQRLLLCQSMWQTCERSELIQVPEITHKVRTLWGGRIEEAESLKIIDKSILDTMLDYNLFPVFYANFYEKLDNYSKKDAYELHITVEDYDLVILGWEVTNDLGSEDSADEMISPLNGYRDYYYLREPIALFPINKWGLFYYYADAQKYVEINNENNDMTGHSWFTIPILTTKNALAKLEEMYQQKCNVD